MNENQDTQPHLATSRPGSDASARESKTPQPGSPEFDEYLDRQATDALQHALANPALRIFAGIACFAFLMAGAGALQGDLWSRIVFIMFFLPMTYEAGYIALTGRTHLRFEGFRIVFPSMEGKT